MAVFFNTRVRIYPNGREIITYASRPVFNPHLDDEDNSVELIDQVVDDPDLSLEEKRSAFAQNNLMRAVVRAKQRIFDIAFCNEWHYFVTLTFNPKLIDHHDPEACKRSLKNWLKNDLYKYRLDHSDFFYLIVPEYGSKNKMIHLHCLMSDLPVVDSGTVLVKGFSKPIKVSNVPSGCEITSKVFNLPLWKKGFSSCIPIYKNDGALSAYFTKYMTKDQKKIWGNYYYSSYNLKREPLYKFYDTPYESIIADEYDLRQANLKVKYVSLLKF